MTDEHHSPDLSDYFAAMKRRRLLLAGVALPIVAIALALAIGLPDIFVSTGLITFTDATVSGELPNRAVRREKAYMDAYVNSLSEAVFSGQNLDRLAREMPGVVPPGEDKADAYSEIVRRTTVETVRVPVLDPDTGREREIISAFTVSYGSRSPEQAQKLATWFTDAFLRASRANLQVRARAAAQFYNNETERYRRQIADDEAKLAKFKAKNFGELPELTNLNLDMLDRTQRDLDDANQQLRTLGQERVFITAQLEAAKNAGMDEGLLGQLQAEYNKKLATYDENHPDMIALRRQIDALRAGGGAVDSLSLPAQLAAQKAILAQARQRYSEDHPDVKRIERQIKTLETRIAAGEKNAGNPQGSPAVVQLKTQLNAIDTQIASQERRQGELRTKLDNLEQRVTQTPQVEREYKDLTRDLDLAKTKYDELLKAQMDSELTGAAIASGRSDELRLIQAPVVAAKATKPKRLVIAGIGLMLAMLLGLTVVVIAESLDQSVRGSRDVRRVLEIAPLGVIPEIHDAATARRQRWRMAALTTCVLVASAAVVMTVRNYY